MIWHLGLKRGVHLHLLKSYVLAGKWKSFGAYNEQSATLITKVSHWYSKSLHCLAYIKFKETVSVLIYFDLLFYHIKLLTVENKWNQIKLDESEPLRQYILDLIFEL